MATSAKLWTGLILIGVGLFMLIGAALKTDFILYKICAARPGAMMGEANKHKAMAVYGLLINVFAILLLTGVIPPKN